MTAKSYLLRINALQSDKELEKITRYFKTGKGEYSEKDKFMGVKMGDLFKLSKEFEGMPVNEIGKLLENEIHEIRAGAVSIMDKESRTKNISDERLKSFFDLYMKKHDMINNWDLVDLGCLHMTGRYLYDKPKDILYRLASSKNMWKRRTAILSTCYFLRKADSKDCFAIAEILLNDKEDLIHKATGWMLRLAYTKDPKNFFKFLERHSVKMPRTMLRAAIEKLEEEKRKYYLQLK